MKPLVFIFVFINIWILASALDCLSCNSVADFKECAHSITTCQDQHESCFLDVSILANLTKVYTAGCRSVKVCDMMDSITGRRSVVGCAKCCSNPPYTDGMPCNGHLCHQHLTFDQQTTVSPDEKDCKDLLNCRLYLAESICPKNSTYRAWAEVRCKVYCGLCDPHTPQPPCINKINNCNEYGADLCSNPLYRMFTWDNCRQFCRLCTTTTAASEATTTVSHPTTKATTEPTTATTPNFITQKPNMMSTLHHNAVTTHETTFISTLNPTTLTSLQPTSLITQKPTTQTLHESTTLTTKEKTSSTTPGPSTFPQQKLTSATSQQPTSFSTHASTNEATTASKHATTTLNLKTANTHVPTTMTSQGITPTSNSITQNTATIDTTSVSSPSTEPQRIIPICEDFIRNCDAYGPELCINQAFMLFREQYCRKHCGFCGDIIELGMMI